MIVRHITKTVDAVEDTMFLVLGANAYGMAMFLHNSGLNSLDYKFQESDENNDSLFTDISDPNEPVSGTIAADGVVLVKITSTKPYIRLRASAAGGSELEIPVIQYVKNTSNVLPILDVQGV